jgi:hypothetical protein
VSRAGSRFCIAQADYQIMITMAMQIPHQQQIRSIRPRPQILSQMPNLNPFCYC